MRFGHLVTVGPPAVDAKGNVLYACRCDCGTLVPAVRLGNLESGNTLSCGCWSRTARRLADVDRDKRIWAMRESGARLMTIAHAEGINESRVSQILRRIKARRTADPTYPN